MGPYDKKFTVICLLLLITSFCSLGLCFRDFTQKDTIDIKSFPRNIGSWYAEELPLTQRQLEILGTGNVFVRKYKNLNGQQVYLYIVYSQSNRKVSHPPEICYAGEGISILEKTRDTIPVDKNLTLQANRLQIEINQLQQMSFYLFKVGNEFTPSYGKQQILVALNTALGRKTGSALIRISADIDQDKQASIKSIKEFTRMITPQLVQYLP